MERLHGSHSVLGWNDSKGVVILSLNDSRRVNLYWDGTIPGESFHPRTAGLQSSNSVLGWNNNWIVLLSWDRTTPGESLSSDGMTPGE